MQLARHQGILPKPSLAASLGARRALGLSQPLAGFTSRRVCRPPRTLVPVKAWGFLKQLGLKKPAFLPDFGAPKRQALLERLFNNPEQAGLYDELLAEDFKLTEEGAARAWSKKEWKEFILDSVLPAIPDFKWTAATDGIADDAGYAIVLTKVTGHHTGAPFKLPGTDLPPVPPSGRRISLPEGVMRAKVESGRVKELSVIPLTGAGPMDLYRAVAGQEAGVRSAPGSGKASYDL